MNLSTVLTIKKKKWGDNVNERSKCGGPNLWQVWALDNVRPITGNVCQDFPCPLGNQ